MTVLNNSLQAWSRTQFSPFFARITFLFVAQHLYNFLLEWASNNSRVCTADGRGESSLFFLSRYFFYDHFKPLGGDLNAPRWETKIRKKNTIDSIKKHNFFFLPPYTYLSLMEKRSRVGFLHLVRDPFSFFFYSFQEGRHSGGSPPIYIINCFI